MKISATILASVSGRSSEDLNTYFLLFLFRILVLYGSVLSVTLSFTCSNSGSLCTRIESVAMVVAMIQLSHTERLLVAFISTAFSKIKSVIFTLFMGRRLRYVENSSDSSLPILFHNL